MNNTTSPQLDMKTLDICFISLSTVAFRLQKRPLKHVSRIFKSSYDAAVLFTCVSSFHVKRIQLRHDDACDGVVRYVS